MSSTRGKFEVSISGGKMKLMEYKGRINKFISNAPDGRYLFELRKKRGVRTTGREDEMSNQNGYYWGVVVPIIKNYFEVEATRKGNPSLALSSKEIHNGVKALFLMDGMFSTFPKIKSTTGLDRAEWEELMQKIRDHFMENYHLNIPEPNQE